MRRKVDQMKPLRKHLVKLTISKLGEIERE